MAAATPLILDVDTGVDDALALGFALRRFDADLLGVTTLAGNIDVGNTTENTRRVLAFLGKTHVPIFQGASRPLVRRHRDAAHYHGANGLGDVQLPESGQELATERGPASIIRMARQRPGEITLVLVGPLTNLAIALNVFPDLPKLLKRVVVMGGAYERGGNITPHAEFNIWADPEAAEQVFATEFSEAIAVGLDVSHQTLLTRECWEQANAVQDPYAQLLTAVCHRSFVERKQLEFPLHDPLATAVALDPTLVTTRRGHISVRLEGEQEGRTVLAEVAGGPWQVAYEVDARRFVHEFLAAYGLLG